MNRTRIFWHAIQYVLAFLFVIMVSSSYPHPLRVVCLILNIRILNFQVHDMIDIKPCRTVVKIFVDN